jgi:SAM-dependent methyltransferase
MTGSPLAEPHVAAGAVGDQFAGAEALNGLLRCPVEGCGASLSMHAERLRCDTGRHQFSVESGIPRLFVANEWRDGRHDVTDLVKAFYEETPFPNYDGLDTRHSLRVKATKSIFGRMLDQQISHSAKILEVGCGTGQMTNFLGMGFGRVAVGADVCVNSLGLAKNFRDCFSINNAHFVQANLFRPPFAPESFDVVISNGVLHHTGDCAGGFRAIAALVKPGGAVAVGLYNRLGRLPTLWLRAMIARFGQSAAVLDHRLRGRGEVARREAWYMDQYQHPHETRHSMGELLGWFDNAGFDFTASIPTIGDTEFNEDIAMFEPRPAGTRLDRLASELEMLLTAGRDGGLFVMIGRKRV